MSDQGAKKLHSDLMSIASKMSRLSTEAYEVVYTTLLLSPESKDDDIMDADYRLHLLKKKMCLMTDKIGEYLQYQYDDGDYDDIDWDLM